MTTEEQREIDQRKWHEPPDRGDFYALSAKVEEHFYKIRRQWFIVLAINLVGVAITALR